MNIPPPIARTGLLLLAALTLAGLGGCRDKHEPVKPTVAVAPLLR